jgi:hypothetical protein
MVFPYRGVYVTCCRVDAVAEANQVLFFNEAKVTISHPVGRWRDFSLVVAEPLLRELIPKEQLREEGSGLPRPAPRIDARTGTRGSSGTA